MSTSAVQLVPLDVAPQKVQSAGNTAPADDFSSALAGAKQLQEVTSSEKGNVPSHDAQDENERKDDDKGNGIARPYTSGTPRPSVSKPTRTRNSTKAELLDSSAFHLLPMCEPAPDPTTPSIASNTNEVDPNSEANSSCASGLTSVPSSAVLTNAPIVGTAPPEVSQLQSTATEIPAIRVKGHLGVPGPDRSSPHSPARAADCTAADKVEEKSIAGESAGTSLQIPTALTAQQAEPLEASSSGSEDQTEVLEHGSLRAPATAHTQNDDDSAVVKKAAISTTSSDAGSEIDSASASHVNSADSGTELVSAPPADESHLAATAPQHEGEHVALPNGPKSVDHNEKHFRATDESAPAEQRPSLHDPDAPHRARVGDHNPDVNVVQSVQAAALQPGNDPQRNASGHSVAARMDAAAINEQRPAQTDQAPKFPPTQAHFASGADIAQLGGSYPRVVHDARLLQQLSGSEWRVGLQVPELGRMEIKTTTHEGSTQAQLSVERPDVHRLLAVNETELGDSLARQNIQFSGTTLMHSDANTGHGEGHQPEWKSPQNHHPHSQGETTAKNATGSSSAIIHPQSTYSGGLNILA